jgi:nucleoside-diphosphate-sugar epimerase
MDAAPEKVRIRSSYNVASMSFNPAELSNEIKKHLPEFKISYKPDVRQQYAQSWPQSIDDSQARKDWGWKPDFDLSAMTEEMLQHIQHSFNFSIK